MATVKLSEETALEALRSIKYPGFSRDIVSFGFVKDLATGGGNVSFRLALTADAPAVAEQIRAECEAALRTGLPIVPIAVSGARDVVGADSLWIRRVPVTIRVGDPIPTAGLTVSEQKGLMERVRREMLHLHL